MSYYSMVKGDVHEAAAGLGAHVKTGKFRSVFKDRAMRRPRAMRAMRSYAGFGAIEFNGAQGWADQTACDAAWQTSQTTIPQCNWVNLMRAGLAQLGYGQLSQGQSWGAADIAAYKSWCTKQGMPATTYPTKDGWMLMEKQVDAGTVTGDKPPVEMTKSGDTFIPTGLQAGAGAKTGMSAMTLGLIAVGIIGIAAIAIAAKKRRGSSASTPVSGPLPVPMKANPYRRRRRRHHR